MTLLSCLLKKQQCAALSKVSDTIDQHLLDKLYSMLFDYSNQILLVEFRLLLPLVSNQVTRCLIKVSHKDQC